MGGGLLSIGYCSRTIGYCFPYYFLEIFVGDKALMEGDKVVMGDPPVLPLGKTLNGANRVNNEGSNVLSPSIHIQIILPNHYNKDLTISVFLYPHQRSEESYFQSP